MIPVFDGHNDSLTRADHDRLAAGRHGGHVDLPRMAEGGMRGGSSPSSPPRRVMTCGSCPGPTA